MYHRSAFKITVVAVALLALLFAPRCGTGPAAPPTSTTEPSRELARSLDAAGRETTTYSVQLATQAGAIERLTERAARLAHDSAERRLLAAELIRTRHVRAATVFTSRTPAGDTVRHAVVLREERAPGTFGFLKPREAHLDVRQLTPGGVTLAAQSFAVPAAPPKRWAVGVVAGYGIGPDLTPRPFVGVGLTRTLIRF